MMNGEEFIKSTDNRPYYIESCIKVIIYGYFELLSSNVCYKRSEIQRSIRKILGSDNSLNEIEDYLCDDLVNNFIKPNKHLFGLNDFSVNTGVRESNQNVKVGVLDIKFELPTLLKNHYYIFEAKRLDKYSAKQNYYINHGIYRFTNGAYYPESDIVVAGMIGFVEVDQNKFKNGKQEISVISKSLNGLIKKHSEIKTFHELIPFPLKDETFPALNTFKYLYVSKHLRKRDKENFHIYHLLLDYYDLLKN